MPEEPLVLTLLNRQSVMLLTVDCPMSPLQDTASI